MHLLDLANSVKQGVQKAGLVGYRFNTVGVSDGISMGTEGMSFSLQSREIIADSIETVCFLLLLILMMDLESSLFADFLMLLHARSPFSHTLSVSVFR